MKHTLFTAYCHECLKRLSIYVGNRTAQRDHDMNTQDV